MEGDVRVKRSGEFHWESASPKMLLKVGDQIKTSGAAVVEFAERLKAEDERGIREGLTEDELEIFDLLKKPKMNWVLAVPLAL